MPPHIPLDVADITAAWLQGALNVSAPGAKLSAIDVIESDSGTTGRARVSLTHEDPRLPPSVFVKLAPFDADQRAFVEQTGMGVAEARFYAEIATDVAVRYPTPWYAAHDGERYVMVLEDLRAAGARYPTLRDPDLPAFVERTIEAFATLHGPFWESPRFSADGDLAWVVSRSQNYGSAAGLVGFAVEQLGTDLPTASRRLAEVYLPRAERIPDILRAGARTLVHGDPHLGNLFIDRTKPGFLDWAMVGCAPGLRDVAYFLGGSVPVDLRRAHERQLVERYCEQLHNHGVTLDTEQAWETYRVHLLTAWIAAVVTAGMGSKLQPIALGMAATKRADAAICDHDVAGLLSARLP